MHPTSPRMMYSPSKSRGSASDFTPTTANSNFSSAAKNHYNYQRLATPLTNATDSSNINLTPSPASLSQLNSAIRSLIIENEFILFNQQKQAEHKQSNNSTENLTLSGTNRSLSSTITPSSQFRPSSSHSSTAASTVSSKEMLAELLSKLNSTETALFNEKSNAALLQQQLNQENSLNKRQAQLIQQLKSELSGLKEQQLDENSDSGAIQRLQSEFLTQLHEKNTLLSAVQAKYTALLADFESFKENSAKSQEVIETLSHERSELLAQQKNQANQLLSTLHSMEFQLNSSQTVLHTQISQQSEEITHLNSVIEQLAGEIQEEKANSEDKRAQIAVLSAEKEKTGEIQRELGEITAKYDQKCGEVSEINGKLLAVQLEIKEILREKSESAKNKAIEHAAQLEKLQSDYSSRMSQLSSEIQVKNGQINGTVQRYNELFGYCNKILAEFEQFKSAEQQALLAQFQIQIQKVRNEIKHSKNSEERNEIGSNQGPAQINFSAQSGGERLAGSGLDYPKLGMNYVPFISSPIKSTNNNTNISNNHSNSNTTSTGNSLSNGVNNSSINNNNTSSSFPPLIFPAPASSPQVAFLQQLLTYSQQHLQQQQANPSASPNRS
jgi:chromosome segregation ATPase